MFRKLLLFFAACFFTFSVLAGEALFTWTKPTPAFNVTPPLGWIIDEYRINCSILDSAGVTSSWTATVPGYDTETYLATGLVPGAYDCYAVSYSVGAGTESVPSAITSKVIADEIRSLPPTLFVFDHSL